MVPLPLLSLPLLYWLSQLQEGADMGKYPSSPTPAVRPGLMALEEDRHASTSGTPRSGVGADATGVAWADRRRSLGESVSSTPSEGDSADVAQGSVGEQLFYVHQLRERMSKEQIEMRSLIRYFVRVSLLPIRLSRLDGLSNGDPSTSAVYRGLACSPWLCDVATQRSSVGLWSISAFRRCSCCVSASWRPLALRRMRRLPSRLNWRNSWRQRCWTRSAYRI